MRTTCFLGSLSLTLAILTVAGCGDTSPSGPPAGGTPGAPAESLSGSVVIDGSSTVFRISKAAQVGFKKVHGDVKVLLGNHGTGGGFSRYLEKEIDIVDASRPAKPEEESKAKENGLDWTRYLVGYDGITLVAHPDNTFVKSLSVAQLKKLFAPGSTVKTWKELDPSWPDRKIVLYTPDSDSGTFEFFAEAIIGAKSQRKDVQASPDDNTLVTGVAGDPDGLGYFGYAYYNANKAKLRAIPIQKGPEDKPVEPTLDTILKKEYAPLSRPLYIYVKNESMKRPEVGAFLSYYLENVDKLASAAGYVPPTADDRTANGRLLAGPAK